MKVGFIFECGPKGADKLVCEHLAQQLVPAIEIVSVTLENKPGLLTECGEHAAGLLKDGCERVLIIWDLFPAWRAKGQAPCRTEDRKAIFESLKGAEVALERVHLVCIEEELEAWIIADERALCEVLSRPTHPYQAPVCRAPEKKKNPKKYLIQAYGQRGRTYVDHIEAIRIIKAFPDLNRLRKRCATFSRFEERLKLMAPTDKG